MVALKETSTHEADELRREFVLLARLSHPNLVRVYDFFAQSPIAATPDEAAPAAYTQEWVDGPNVYEALREATCEVRQEVFIQILRALAYLHALDVIHCDLKPENVLVESGLGLQPRLLDFGIAVSGEENLDAIKGSRSYLAPERLRGARATPATDLYALGVMMAEVWMGHPPDPALLSGELSNADARSAYFEERRVPASWLEVVTRLTAQDPSMRPASVAEVSRLWGRSLGQPIVLHTPGSVAAILRSGPLVGRDEERARAMAALQGGEALVVSGVNGIGKTMLARTLVRELQVLGHPVEYWPEIPDAASIEGLTAALERLCGCADLSLTGIAGLYQPPPRGTGGAASGADYEGWCKEVAGKVVDAVISRKVMPVTRAASATASVTVHWSTMPIWRGRFSSTSWSRKLMLSKTRVQSPSL